MTAAVVANNRRARGGGGWAAPSSRSHLTSAWAPRTCARRRHVLSCSRFVTALLSPFGYPFQAREVLCAARAGGRRRQVHHHAQAPHRRRPRYVALEGLAPRSTSSPWMSWLWLAPGGKASACPTMAAGSRGWKHLCSRPCARRLCCVAAHVHGPPVHAVGLHARAVPRAPPRSRRPRHVHAGGLQPAAGRRPALPGRPDDARGHVPPHAAVRGTPHVHLTSAAARNALCPPTRVAALPGAPIVALRP